MLRTVVLLAFVLGCSKAKDQEQATPSPPPAAEPAAADPAATGSAEGSADGSAAGSAEGSAEGSASAEAPAAASDFDFEKLAHDDKVKFMKEKVMPKMKPLFQDFDAKEFKNVTCKTCHGKDPKGSKYKMPSKDLPALDFDAIKAGKEDPKMVEFMSKVVKPEMAKLLNQPEMTEDNPTGFGCLACHEMKKKK